MEQQMDRRDADASLLLFVVCPAAQIFSALGIDKNQFVRHWLGGGFMIK